MLCDICQKKEATFFFKGIFNEKTVKLNLCEECAKQKGVEIKPFSLSDFFSTLTDFEWPSLPEVKVKKQLTCPQCKLSYSELKGTGKLGCSNCYDVFSQYLDMILKKMYGEVKHYGKKLVKGEKEMSVEQRIELLKKQLQEAIENEEYEKAAEIRDKIKRLQQ